MNRRLVLVLTLGALGSLLGCEGPGFTQANYERIESGLHERKDVWKLLGAPDHEAGDTWFYEDLKRHVYAQVFFDDDGHVRDKEWIDAQADWTPDAASKSER